MFTTCQECGMLIDSAVAYHPYAACVMFRQLGQGEKVESNLRAVVEYGMRAAEWGVDLNTAMRDISKVRMTDRYVPVDE